MPLYEFRCLECGAILERVQPWDSDVTPVCACGGVTKRLISVCMFYFKGGSPAANEAARVRSFEELVGDDN